MADPRPEMFYSVTVTAENAFVRLYVNGAPLLLHGQFSPMLVTVPITDMLQPGTNRVTIDYEPFDLEAQAFTPHEGVALQVGLTRESNALAETRVSQRVTLFAGRHDPELGQMVSLDSSPFGQGDLQRQDGALGASDVSLEPVEIVYTNRVSDGNGMRLRMSFPIEDTPMPTPVWADAPVLEDTPELRAELTRVYAALHQIVASGDEAAYRGKTQLLYDHLALTTGYTDARAMADAVRARTPLGPPEGQSLAPLPADLSAGLLEFGSDGRLVRFAPDPIHFLTADGARAGGYGFFFCQKQDRLEICHLQDIPY